MWIKRVRFDLVLTIGLATLAAALPVLSEANGWLWSPLVYLAYGAICSVPLLLLTLDRFHRVKLGACLAFVATLSILWNVPFTVPGRFARVFFTIGPGMDVAQVRAKLEPWVRGTSWPDLRPLGWGPLLQSAIRAPAGPHDTNPWTLTNGTLVFPGKIVYHGSAWADRLNADWWEVHISNGKVVSSRFIPD